MTRKLWFQVGIGILISLFIIKYIVDVNWIFSPILIVAKTIFLPLLLGGVLFYITVPIQTFLEKQKIPRWGSISIIFVTLIGLLWVAVSIIGPLITEQVNNLIENTPAIVQETNNLIMELLRQAGDLPKWVDKEIEKATDSISTITSQFGIWIVTFFQSVIQGTLILVLTPFFLFFMLKDHEKFLPAVTKFFSGETKKWVHKTFSDIDDVLSLYIRGQILISSILAIMLFIGYYFIGLNFALLLAVFAFFMNVIPFIGPWIAFIPALLIAFFQDPIMVVWVSLITLVAQQTDANLITPNIMGKTLNIHPLTIITVLLAAGKIAGLLGILLAVPGYAVGKAIVSNLYEKRLAIRKAANKTI
ncbi:AI-2E family transporter [Pseudogracilibacillus auburnensis]|uniref:Putative PurR-regulated permease PerM n=1 Tax=Pseudogracilibacillus auburnensis TaxID=1494959 RepID=A0A2V3VES9_9BACI|nr:AI-2E family transporter [Pseudogracilibacillus auburnensis]MBO1005872.1 AI-2E family transporter [Pseudogracilibacillus auburnensis]PXW80326.1 putative PurR-regulated permease PerM [Pseudogracilibacillus auburnensis]